MIDMFLKIFAILLLSSISLLAEYRYMGSFKAGESISGAKSLQSNYTGLEYDFVVDKYCEVEFKPQEEAGNLVQYAIRDKDNLSHSYFYVGAAEGITSSSTDDAIGWKIGMMPGTYKVIVFTSYYEGDTDEYNLVTVATPSSDQTPLTGMTLNKRMFAGGYANPATPISLNTKYNDNLGYYKDTGEQLGDGDSYSFIDSLDIFSFSLSEESNVTRVITIDGETAPSSLFYLYIKRADGTTACSSFYSSQVGEKISDSCKLDAGEYYLEIEHSGYNDYSFELRSESSTLPTSVVDDGVNSVAKANFDDFRVSYCGSYVDTVDGLKVNGSAYRYGNYLRTKKSYDVIDSVTKMRWKANSSSYSYFSPTIVNIASGNMTTDHSYAGSTKIENDTWYYTTITVSGDKVTTVTSKNDYATSGDDVVDSRDGTLTDRQLSLSKNGVEIGFSMGDTYGSTTASFTVSNFSTTAKEVAKNLQRDIILNNNVSDVFSDVVGDWSFVDNQLQIVNGNLNDRVVLDVSNIDGITFKAMSNQNQSNFVVRTLDKDGGVISAVTLDPSTNSCFKDYYLSTTNDVTQVEFFFTTSYSIEHYESSYKDIYIKDIQLQYISDEQPSVTETGYDIVDFSLVDNGDEKEVSVEMGDKNTTITLPPESDVFENSDGGITTITPTTSETQTVTTLNNNGTLSSEIDNLIDGVDEKTKILVDLVVDSFDINYDNGSIIKARFGEFMLNLTTDSLGRVTPSYFMGDREVIMPTFNSGSVVSVKTENNDVMIEIQTKLTSRITFQK